MIDITKIQNDEQLTVDRTEMGLEFRIEKDGESNDFIIEKYTPEKEINVIFLYKINEFRGSLFQSRRVQL